MQRSDGLSLKEKINDQILDHPFTDYWDIFILKHQNPVNVVFHMIGILILYGVLLAAWIGHSPWVLIALPLTQLVGLAGHLLFERSHIDWQDAIFSWRASVCLGRMLLCIVLGKYPEEIRKRQQRLRDYQSSLLSGHRNPK